MILPELALIVSAASRLRCLPGLRVNAIQGEILMDQPNFAMITRDNLAQRRLCLFAERTLKIFKLDDRHCCLFRAFERSVIQRHIGAKDGWRCQISYDLCLCVKRLHKQLSLCCQPLVMKKISNFLLNLLKRDWNPSLVGIV